MVEGLTLFSAGMMQKHNIFAFRRGFLSGVGGACYTLQRTCGQAHSRRNGLHGTKGLNLYPPKKQIHQRKKGAQNGLFVNSSEWSEVL